MGGLSFSDLTRSGGRGLIGGRGREGEEKREGNL